MPRNWKALADGSDGIYTESDFKQALYQLVVQQCLYARFKRQSVAYRLISEYRDAFTEAADLMGLRLSFNDRLEFCYVTQDETKVVPMDLQETRFLLVLRQVYHLRANEGLVDEFGAAGVGIAELAEVYQDLAGVPLDTKASSLRAMLKTTARSGFAREVKAPDGDPQPFVVEVLPGIASVINETAVARFGAALKASLLQVPAPVVAPVDADAHAVESEGDVK